MTIGGEFQAPTVQRLERDPNRQQQFFEAELKVASTERNTFGQIADGIEKGIQVAGAVQQLQSTELDMRQKELNLQKTKQAQEILIEQKEQERELLNDITTGTEAEQVAALDGLVNKYPPKVIENMTPSILMQLRRLGVNGNPMTQDVVKQELLPRYDEEVRNTNLKQQMALDRITATGEQQRITKREFPPATSTRISPEDKQRQKVQDQFTTQQSRAIRKGIESPAFNDVLEGTDQSGVLNNTFKTINAAALDAAQKAQGRPFKIPGLPQTFNTYDEALESITRGVLAEVSEQDAALLDPELQNLRRRQLQAMERSRRQQANVRDQEDSRQSVGRSIGRRVPTPDDTGATEREQPGFTSAETIPETKAEVRANRARSSADNLARARSTRRTLLEHGIEIPASREIFGDFIPIGPGRVENTALKLAESIVERTIAKAPGRFQRLSPQERAEVEERTVEKLTAEWTEKLLEMVRLGE